MEAADLFSVYTDGQETEYEAILKSLRNSLNSIPALAESVGGAIIFFRRKNKEEQDLKTTLFPFKLNQAWIKDKVFTNEQLINLFKQLNQEQSYTSLWHYKEFKDNYNSDNHLFTKIPEENVLHYDAERVSSYKSEIAWNEFYRRVLEKKEDKHTYEQLLFSSGCKEVIYIPLPVLSTPFVLLVLNSSDVKGDLDTRLRQMYFRTRDSISKYLYSTLIDSLTSYLQKFGETASEEDVVRQFVEELCHIFLPISYKINEAAETEYYGSWPISDRPSDYILNLLGGKYIIRFQLTSFGFVDFEQPHSTHWRLFHETQLYKSTIDQSSVLIGKVFNLIHKYWSQLRLVQINTYNKIAVEISHMHMDSLMLKVEEMKEKFDRMKAKAKELGDFQPLNSLKCNNDKVSLIVNREDLILPSEKLGISQYRGFQYLQFIVGEAEKKKYVYSIPVHDLCLAVTPDLLLKQSHDDKRRNLALQAAQEMIAELQSFINTMEDEIRMIIIDKRESRNETFNQGFYSMYNLHQYMKKTKVYYIADLNQWNTKRIHSVFSKLQKVYSQSSEFDFRKKWERLDISVFIQTYDRHRGHLFTGNYVQGIVRNSFKAMFQLVKHRAKVNLKNKNAFRIFINNLKMSGLINAEKEEPASQTIYTYNQQGLKDFIEWEMDLLK